MNFKNIPNGVIRGHERLYITVKAKISSIHAYWTPKGNSHRMAFLMLAVSAKDLKNKVNYY